MPTIQELTEQRAAAWSKAKAILDKADAETRTLTKEEREQYDRAEADVDRLGAEIDTAQRRERAEARDREFRTTQGRRVPVEQPGARNENRGDMGEAMRSWLTRMTGRNQTAEELGNAADCGVQLDQKRQAIRIGKATSKRAIGITTASAGGALATWHDFADLLDRALLMYGSAKDLVKVLPTPNGITLPVPTIDDTANEAVIVAEAGAIPITPDPTTGTVNLAAFKYSTRAIQVAVELIQDSLIDLATLLPDLLAERLGRAINRHIIAGTGSGQPNGIIPRATASGLVVGGTVAAPTFTGDLFIDLMHSVDPAYRNSPGAGFLMHDTIVQRARKLKDNNGQYLWQVSLQAGQPDRLLGYPLYVNQHVPTLAANARIAAFGDYKRYTWREVAQMDLYRLDELYIMNGQIAFMGLYRGDGNLINTSAVRTLAAPAS